ncbi:putative Ig domain-containing protein [Sorangium atrum]|uniref:Alpha-galactosidase n=1 Tax=Sorangium atrum TaxID=2995308 RepID=A0ABT5BYC5_9BACT|nr:putative Ig domain-containing protein [Sorangium aterium]MDC0678753.1 putative Ig domain-containing protein [Sorangium aterium]
MQRPRAFLLLAGATLATTSALSGAAHAQSSIDISMTEAPATPRLQGPFVYGAAPSSPFLFAIPATGRAPLEFSVSGLPAGLTLTSSTGIISGKTPAAGSYPVQVTVTNAAGTASATYTLQSGSTLALTPPMGWNSYDSFGASVTEQDMLEQAQAVRTYLQPYGWNTVVIDYRWYEPGQPIDANGRYVPATGKYPSATGSNGFKSLADGIHAMGLGFGIHIMRGVPRKSYNANLPIAGSSYTTRDAGNPDDPCPWDEHMWGVRGDTPAGQAWYDALFQQYASWGVDFVKIDDMLNNSTRRYHQAEADAIHRAVEKTGRSIMLSFSPGPNDPSWLIASSGHLNSNANMWRVVNDFWDYNALTDLPGVLRAASTWQGVSDLTPGHWPDLDMLPLGYLGPRNEWHASGQTRFTKNEQVTIMSLWTMLPSPLMFGGNPARLGSDAWTLALLTNEEVLAVNQDALGARGRRTTVDGGEIWVRDLSGDRKAVAFFNHGDQDMTMSVSLSQLGVTGTPVIRDLWRRADVSGMSDALSADVPAGAALMYTLSPPGGTGEVSSAAATSGSSGGASTSEGGAGGGGGDTGGGGGAVTAGVSAGGAGSGGEAGAAGSTGEPSGCGCTVPGHRRAPAALLLLLATTALGALRRRAARRNDANVVCR